MVTEVLASGVGADSYLDWFSQNKTPLSSRTTSVNITHRARDGGSNIMTCVYNGLQLEPPFCLERSFREVIREGGQWEVFTFPNPDERWRKLLYFL